MANVGMATVFDQTRREWNEHLFDKCYIFLKSAKFFWTEPPPHKFFSSGAAPACEVFFLSLSFYSLEFLLYIASHYSKKDICRTFFLSGLRNSLKKMAEPSRLIASIVYFLMIGLTLFAGLSLRSPPIAIFCIIGQYLAMFWYSITYIPYARFFVSTDQGRCCIGALRVKGVMPPKALSLEEAKNDNTRN